MGFVLLSVGVFAQTPTKESRMFLHPFREVYVNFPSEQLGLGVRLTVFLPEEKIPLAQSYPLVVYLGMTPQEMETGEKIAREERVVLAGVRWESWAGQTVQDPKAVEKFIHLELLPYLETNYPILRGSEFRTLAATGQTNAQAVVNQLVHPDWVGKFALIEPGNFEIPSDAQLAGVRFYVNAPQAQLATAQAQLQAHGVPYGPGFVLSYPKSDKTGLAALDFHYLNEPKKNLVLKRAECYTQKDFLAVHSAETVGMRVAGQLKNGYWFSYVPQTVRFSPPYLAWDPAQGTLAVIPGAQRTTVKIRVDVDNLSVSTKIKLKNK